MIFVFTKAVVKNDEVVINGYFKPENQAENIMLAAAVNVAKNYLNDHFKSNGKTLFFEHIQCSLLNMNLKRLQVACGIRAYKFLYSKNFVGERTLLKGYIKE